MLQTYIAALIAMLQTDIVALVASYVYVFAVLVAAELLGRFVFHGSTSFTRKFVHVGVGMWVIGTVLLFKNWQMAIIPPLTFIVINYVSYRRDIFKAIQSSDKRNLGTVYFPISFALVIALCWARPAVVLAALMPMTWGDALAAVIGERWGRRKYTSFGKEKSWEGSAAMFFASLASVLFVLLTGGAALAIAVGVALMVAALATLAEAFTPLGLDNLSVPLVSAILLWLLL